MLIPILNPQEHLALITGATGGTTIRLSLFPSLSPSFTSISPPTPAVPSLPTIPHLTNIPSPSTGIGRATCLALAALGCSIAVHYNTAEKEAEELVKELRAKYGVRAEAFGADLREYGEVRRLHTEVTNSLGHPNILFANAGLTLGKSNIKSIHDISIEDFENTWRANCGSAFLLTQLCLPAMEEKGWGRVIFCSSVAGFTGGVVGPHYASSKSALHGLIHWLSGAYCSKGITVNGVAPALIQDTKMLPGSSEELAKSKSCGRRLILAQNETDLPV